jgi:hypothetical protein
MQNRISFGFPCGSVCQLPKWRVQPRRDLMHSSSGVYWWTGSIYFCKYVRSYFYFWSRYWCIYIQGSLWIIGQKMCLFLTAAMQVHPAIERDSLYCFCAEWCTGKTMPWRGAEMASMTSDSRPLGGVIDDVKICLSRRWSPQFPWYHMLSCIDRI